jgi:hypothetical protein
MLLRKASVLVRSKAAAETTQIKKKNKSQDVARTHAQLWISVCEARDLPRMDVGGKSDGYVIVQAGHHHYRTRTIWRNLNPMWGDDLKFDVTDDDLKEIVFTVWDRNNHLQDDIIGCVRVPIDDIKDQLVHEKFHPIQPMSEKEFVTGDIKLRLTYSPPKGDSEGSLTVLVKKARNLAVKDANGFSDPYVKLQLGGHKKKTKVVKKNLSPSWDEEFTFKVKEGDTTLRVAVWDWDMISSSDFMGEVNISLQDLPAGQPLAKWFLLGTDANEEKEDGEDKKSKKKLGDMRVKIKYTEQKLLPLSAYSDLLQLLMEEEEVLGWLYDHTKEPGILASTLVAVFQSQGKATQLLHYLTKKEISSTKSAGVIFRGNTLATKCVDAFMKLIGSSYLHRVLKDHIAAISEDKHSCEVDPSKAEKGDNVAHNMAHLRETAEKITEDIFASADLIPAQFREVFHAIQTTILEQWPEDDTSRYTAVSGFLFLRFFNPAILGPKLFGLLDTFPSFVASRTFTLISKILQNLANLVEFGQKEPFLADMNQYILAKKGDMKRFLDTVSTLAPADKPGLVDETDIDLQVEMATMYHFLVNMRPAIAECHTDSSTFGKLNHVLDSIGRTQFSPHSAVSPRNAAISPRSFLPATASTTGQREPFLGTRRG